MTITRNLNKLNWQTTPSNHDGIELAHAIEGADIYRREIRSDLDAKGEGNTQTHYFKATGKALLSDEIVWAPCHETGEPLGTEFHVWLTYTFLETVAASDAESAVSKAKEQFLKHGLLCGFEGARAETEKPAAPVVAPLPKGLLEQARRAAQ